MYLLRRKRSKPKQWLFFPKADGEPEVLERKRTEIRKEGKYWIQETGRKGKMSTRLKSVPPKQGHRMPVTRGGQKFWGTFCLAK